MNEGARAAKGRILIFLHADTFLPADAFHVVHGFMNDHGIAAGAFDLGFDSDRFALRLIARAGSLRSRITRVPFGDQAVFMRREYFDSLGGYREIPLMEDVDLMRRIRRCGGRIAISRSRVRTSARKWEREGVWITTLRNYFIQVSYLLGVSPQRLHGLYYRQNRKPGLPL
jgi:rSAM/selenodomain-associated transferase 2